MYSWLDLNTAFDQLWLDKRDDGVAFSKLFRGESLAKSWVPWRVGILPRALHNPDFYCLYANVPAVNERAVATLKPLLGDAVEFLPLKPAAVQYLSNGRLGKAKHALYAMNVVDTVDALDRALSHYERSSSGDFVRVESYVFDEEILAGRPIFKQRGLPTDRIFVSAEIQKAIEKSVLKGVVFRALREWNFDYWGSSDGSTERATLIEPELEDGDTPPLQANEERIVRAEERVGFRFPDRLHWIFAHANEWCLSGKLGTWGHCARLGDGVGSAEWRYELLALKWAVVPRYWFPFATDGSGNDYLVDCGSDDAQVYFHDHEGGFSPEDGSSNTALGVTLDQFLGFCP